MNCLWRRIVQEPRCASFLVPIRYITILDADIIEKFVRGSGPGGQSVNKTRNNVQLTHIPSGIHVHCQETRDLHQNRAIARKILLNKLELIALGQDSKLGKKIQRKQKRKYNAARRAKKKYGQADAGAKGIVKNTIVCEGAHYLSEFDSDDDTEEDENDVENEDRNVET